MATLDSRQLLDRLEALGLSVPGAILKICLEAALLVRLKDSFAAAGADEGTLWLLDAAQSALAPVWNSGPGADRFVGRHHQPLDAGLVSLVCITGQGLCENAVDRNPGHDQTVDRKLGVTTAAMIAVPFGFHGAIRGVVSCVRLRTAGREDLAASFSPENLAEIEEVIRAVGREIDARPAAAPGEPR